MREGAMKVHELMAYVGGVGIAVYAWFTLAAWQAIILSLVAAFFLAWELRDLRRLR